MACSSAAERGMLPIGSVKIAIPGNSILTRPHGASIERWRCGEATTLYRSENRFDYFRSRGHLVHLEIALRRNAEGVGYAVEEGKHRRDVNRLRNLRLTPTMVAQDLYVLRRCAVSCFRHFGHILKQRAVCVVQRSLFEVARNQRLDCLLFCSLNPQEVSMRIQSIGTLIEPGDPAGDCFFCPASKVPFRKVDRIAEAHDLAQEIGTMAKALENAGHLLAARMRAPFLIYLRNIASRVGILNHFDFCLSVCHGSCWPKISISTPPGRVRALQLRKNPMFLKGTTFRSYINYCKQVRLKVCLRTGGVMGRRPPKRTKTSF
jgi:hypothetical protein